jgi:hypothetical protein
MIKCNLGLLCGGQFAIDIGLRIPEGDLETRRVDTEQHLVFLRGLIVMHQDIANQAGGVGGDPSVSVPVGCRGDPACAATYSSLVGKPVRTISSPSSKERMAISMIESHAADLNRIANWRSAHSGAP